MPVVFDLDDHIDEPVRLQRLMESARGLFRHAFADLGNLVKLRLTLRVVFFFRYFFCERGVAVRKGGDGVAQDDACLLYTSRCV